MERYASWVKAHANQIIVFSILAFFVAAAGMLSLRFSTDFRVYLGKDHPDVQTIDQLEEEFTKNETLFVAVEYSSEGKLDPSAFRAIAELTDALWDTPHSRRVDSVTNYQYSYAEGDEIVVEDLVKHPEQLSDSELSRVENIASTEPFLKNFLYAPDGRAAGIQVTLHLDESLERRMQQTPEAVSFVRSTIAEFESLYPGLDMHLAGSVMMNQVMGEAAIQDVLYLVPVCYFVIITLMLFLLRSVVGVTLTMGVVTLANGFTLGLTGWADPVLAPIVGFVPNAILVIAVADCIHILTTYYSRLSKGDAVSDAVYSSLSQNFKSITLTSITSIVGFLCLNFNESPPYRDLGNMVALGTLFAYVLSVLLLPAILYKLPRPKRVKAPGFSEFMPRLGGHIVRNHKVYFVGCLLFVVPLGYLATKNNLNDNWNNYFDDSFQLRKDSDRINESLTGLHRLDFEVVATEGGNINSPDYLAFLDRFSSWLRAQEGVRYVSGLSDTMSRLNMNMHGDDPSYYTMPDNDLLSAQYLLFYEMSLPYGLDMNHQVAFDKQSSRVTVVLDKTTSEEVLRTADSIQHWLDANTVPEVQVSEAIGLDVAFGNIARSNTQSMLWGTLSAFVIISLIIGVANRSVKYGLISLLPNIVPAFIAFGVWAITVNQVGLATSAVVSMAIGIIVDDTIHFLNKYRHAKNTLDMSVDGALEYAFSTVGVAMVISTIILASGFVILGFSPFEPTSHLGNLLALTIVSALLFDLIFVPCLLRIFDREPSGDPAAFETPSNSAQGQLG